MQKDCELALDLLQNVGMLIVRSIVCGLFMLTNDTGYAA